MKKRYRIVRDGFAGFEVQHKYPFWPFWVQTGFSNTHLTVEQAEEFARRHAYGVKPTRPARGAVKDLGVLP